MINQLLAKSRQMGSERKRHLLCLFAHSQGNHFLNQQIGKRRSEELAEGLFLLSRTQVHAAILRRAAPYERHILREPTVLRREQKQETAKTRQKVPSGRGCSLRKGLTGSMQRCLDQEEANKVMKELHSGDAGEHQG